VPTPQAFRHLYVLATEARCVEAVDVDTWEPVYVPLHITVAGDAGHSQGTFQRVTPCLLPERGSLLRVVMSSPRYWPQV
jgi:anaphase-promoting complex subunit 1